MSGRFIGSEDIEKDSFDWGWTVMERAARS